MTDKLKSPSRVAGYAGLVRDLVDRDGLTCTLCGHKHSSVHTAQADSLKSDAPFVLENLILTCKPCAKRRNGKPLGAYWRERLEAASAEVAHIRMMGESKQLLSDLAAISALTVPLGDVTGAQKPNGEANPWDNLPRRVRFYNGSTLKPDEYDATTNRPKYTQHGDVYVDYENSDEELIYDGLKQKWVYLDAAKERGLIPEQWPPADVEPWNVA